MKTKLKARFVIGYDPKQRDHVYWKNGQVVFEGDRVLSVGPADDTPADVVKDYGLSLIAPGFVDLNALADIDTSVIDFDQKAGERYRLNRQWSQRYVKEGPRDVFSAGETLRGGMYSLVQHIRRGTTTVAPVTGLLHRGWAEGRKEFEGLAQIARELGLRTYLGPSFRSGVNVVTPEGKVTTHWDEEAGKKGLAESTAFLRDLKAGGKDSLIQGLLVPSTIETCSPELLLATAAAAAELDLPVRLHATQSMQEFCLIRERYHRTPVEQLEALGLLNRRLLLPHCLYITGISRPGCGEGDDLGRIAASGAAVLHCPFVLAESGTALITFQKLRERGIPIALATDCYPPDMIRNMYVGIVMCLVQGDTATTADLYRAATLAGAEALGREDLGRLCPGSKADIAVFDLDSFHLGQIDDPLRTLVLNGSGTDAIDVFIDGRQVMENRRIPGVDLGELHHWSQGYFGTLKASYAKRAYERLTPEELFPPAFPIQNEAMAQAGSGES